MRALRFTVQSRPRGKSAAGSRVQGGRFTPKLTRDFMCAVRTTAQLARAQHGWRPAEGAVGVGMLALFPRVQRLDRKGQDPGRRRHSVKPDADNICKGLQDALTQAGVVVDDCVVDTLLVRKRYAARGEDTCVHVVVVADTADGNDAWVTGYLIRELGAI